MPKEFVHEQHANDFAEKYRFVRAEYADFCEVVRQLLRSILKEEDYAINSIDCRAKDVESFRLKAGQPSTHDRNRPKYDNPLEEIKDLAGVRIITYVTGVIPLVVRAIGANFNVIESEDKGVSLVQEGRLGYQSFHLLVEFKEPRLSLPEYSRFKKRVCEIQVRSILQHAWAELEHDIRYKSVGEAPEEISRRFVALAGLIEIADREFQTIQDKDCELRAALRPAPESNPEPATGEIPIDLPSPQLQLTDLGSESLNIDLSPKELLLLGRYADAIEKYSRNIDQTPRSHSLYVGRARARFLNDDRAGALKDLQVAESIDPSDITISRLREQMELGIVGSSSLGNCSDLASRGHDALERGDGQTALEFYIQAASLGFKPIFAAIDQGMALLLLNRLREAQLTLMSIRPREQSYDEINVFALRLMAQRLAGKRVDLSHFSGMLSGSGFDFARSPLRHLKKGFAAIATDTLDAVSDIFTFLEQKSNSSWSDRW